MNDIIKKDDLRASIQSKIYVIRGQRVMLDFDLAAMYGVETRVLNQSVKRNIERFPEDFMFQLTKGEFDILKSQIVISNIRENDSVSTLTSQNVIVNGLSKDLSDLFSLRMMMTRRYEGYTISWK